MVDPLTSKSDWLLISLYIVAIESNLKVIISTTGNEKKTAWSIWTLKLACNGLGLGKWYSNYRWCAQSTVVHSVDTKMSVTARIRAMAFTETPTVKAFKTSMSVEILWVNLIQKHSWMSFPWRSSLKHEGTKARYKKRGALGTSGSFVNQPSWHTELQNSLSCSQCKALTRGAFLGKFLRFHQNGRICWGLYYLPPNETVFICGGKFEIRNDSLRHRLKLPWRNFMSVSKYWM